MQTLNDQQCAINGQVITPFTLGDLVWAYLLILALEVLYELIKNNADIREIAIFNHACL